MRYVEARLDDTTREEAYRIYVTQSLQLAPQNKYLTKRYVDILTPEKIDIRSGTEIALDVLKRAGLSFKED